MLCQKKLCVDSWWFFISSSKNETTKKVNKKCLLPTYIVLFYKHTLCVRKNVVAFENKTEKVFSLISYFKLLNNWQTQTCLVSKETTDVTVKGKSFSEALILASTNPEYDKRLSFELQSSVHENSMLRTCCVQRLFF